MKIKLLSSLLLTLCTLSVSAKPSVYLPIGIEVNLEQQIDRLFALTTGSPMSKPYALNEIDLALIKLKKLDASLHSAIVSGLKPYRGVDQVSRMGMKFRVDKDKNVAIANQRGLTSQEWGQGIFEGLWRPNDSMLLQVGLDYRVDSGDLVAYNSFFSFGGESLQLDIGYKEHWFSPFKMSSQLISSNAKASPSISLGLSQPASNWWNFDFELFYSKLDEVDQGVRYQNEWHDGRPRLMGTHISVEPLKGWKLGFNRILHFGGGPREVSTKDIAKAFFDPAGNDNTGTDNEFGDQIASVTSLFAFDWVLPAELYFEYGGEDTQGSSNYSLGNQVHSVGLHLPRVTNNIAVRYEYNKWKTAWYTNHNYKFGNTNDGVVYGHFAGDQRVFSDAVPSQVHSLSVDYFANASSFWQTKLVMINNESDATYQYEKGLELQIINSQKWNKYRIESNITLGKDVFDDNYGHASISFFW